MKITINLKNLKDNDIDQIDEIMNDLKLDILKGYRENIKFKTNNFFIRNNYHYEVAAIGSNGE